LLLSLADFLFAPFRHACFTPLFAPMMLIIFAFHVFAADDYSPTLPCHSLSPMMLLLIFFFRHAASL